MTMFPIWSITKERIVLSTPTYDSNRISIIHKHIKTNVNVTKIQWKKNQMSSTLLTFVENVLNTVRKVLKQKSYQ